MARLDEVLLAQHFNKLLLGAFGHGAEGQADFRFHASHEGKRGLGRNGIALKEQGVVQGKERMVDACSFLEVALVEGICLLYTSPSPRD